MPCPWSPTESTTRSPSFLTVAWMVPPPGMASTAFRAIWKSASASAATWHSMAPTSGSYSRWMMTPEQYGELNHALDAKGVRLVNTPDIRARISQEGADPVGSTPEAFAERVQSEIAKWTKVIKASGMPTSN